MTDQSDIWLFRLSVATAASVLVSIAAAQILLTITLIAWAWLRPRRIQWPGYTLPLAVFMATTILALAVSPDPSSGIGTIKKFLLFPMGLLAATFITNEDRVRKTLTAVVGVAAVAGVVAIVQFGMQYLVYRSTGDLTDDPTILARATGFMGHWMTFSGLEMLVWCVALPLTLSLRPLRRLLPFVGLVGVALLISFTRSVWLGSAAGVAIAALYLPLRTLLRLLVPLAAVGIVASGLIWHRLSMSLLLGGFRLEMLDVGLRMIRDHPLFGVGPERIYAEFPAYYLGNNLQNFYYGHLHNNFIHIGAERGLLCLAAFVWLLAQIALDLRGRARSPNPAVKWLAVGCLSVLGGFIIAGLFEYNFGDSEVLMLFLFLVSMSYGLVELETDPAAAESGRLGAQP